MSGGYFEYQQFHINDIAESLERLIKEPPESFGEETINRFKTGLDIIKLSYVYTQRIDWLMSGDDDEESFHRRLQEDIAKLI